jgi:general secretion pathway protein E/type IV pilus assembly protein PilB
MSARQALVSILQASGADSPEAAREIAALAPASGGSWIIAALDSGKIDEVRFAQELANWSRSPYLAVESTRVERSVLELIPSRLVFKHHILPVQADEKVVRVATYDIFNTAARRLAEQTLKGRPIEWVVCARGPLLRTIKSLYGVGAETLEELLQSTRYDTQDESEKAHDLASDDPEASVVKFVNQVIREAIHERATDIHVEPLENDLRIRCRIDGILHEVAVPPQLRRLQNAIISRLKVMAHMDIAERRLPQDGRINLQTAGGAIDVRVSTIPTVNGESISLRLLSRSETLQFGMDRLDMTAEQQRIIQALLVQPNGIILVTGPTGSGKSTTLYSFLTSINSVVRRIITIEEPVEYRLPGVSQIDVKPEINLTFANGLRAILRQDPNVVMVGEIRDFETAEIAIRAAMTGHVVFSTLHTNDAVGGITRLLDMGIESFLLASVVRAFLAQRLVRTICTQCREPASYDPEYLKDLGFPWTPESVLYRGKGCEHCRQTGYRGRVAIYELCVLTEHLRRLVVKKATGTEMKARAVKDGMGTLRSDGWRRVLAGQTTVEEVLRVTQADDLLEE